MLSNKIKDNPLVSIIVPCYNSEAFLTETLDSVLKQTYVHWECIIVNDGSSDDSEQIAQQFLIKDKRFKYIYQVNQGLSSARNAGIRNSMGNYLNFLDSDDLLLPQMVEMLVNKLETDRTIGIAYCGSILSDISLSRKYHIKKKFLEGNLFLKLAHRNIFACHTIIIKRAILELVGYFDTTLFSCEDWDLWLRVAKAGFLFGAVKEDLVIYRMRPFSMSRNAEVFLSSGLRVIQSAHNTEDEINIKKSVACTICTGEQAKIDFLIRCLAISIVQNKVEEAKSLFIEYGYNKSFNIKPTDFKFFINSVRSASGNMDEQDELILQRISSPLLQLLIQMELILNHSGFAIQAIIQIIRGDKFLRNKVLNGSNGRDLLNASINLINTRFLKISINDKN